ncbi:biliverdin-producing heme oxygenase [Bdellovibrio sp. HCB209]|uniref:biliverdin-producing heme oxygenase n=1 Tax=Bdellovibrio sp. HCB209 TaxID=3394354 RepID=UPI0039B52D43
MMAKPMVMLLLKDGTQDLHNEIEKHMPVFRPDFNSQQYAEVLQKMHRFYEGFEKKLETALSTHGLSDMYKDRFKTPRIESDLKSLGTPTKSQPAPSHLPVLDSVPAIAGALYVIEGSSLGGQIITKHLKEKLNMTPEQTQFFGGYGELTGKRWQEFQKWMGELDMNEQNAKLAVSSARETFSSLMECLK